MQREYLLAVSQSNAIYRLSSCFFLYAAPCLWYQHPESFVESIYICLIHILTITILHMRSSSLLSTLFHYILKTSFQQSFLSHHHSPDCLRGHPCCFPIRLLNGFCCIFITAYGQLQSMKAMQHLVNVMCCLSSVARVYFDKTAQTRITEE